jgi:acyl carrier protein
VVLELVRGEAASVLGLATPAGVDAQRAFKDLGFDSLMAIEFRNQLSAASGVSLPATLVFDYATPAAVAGYVLSQVGGEGPDTAASLAAELDRLEPIAATLEDAGERADVAARLRSLLERVEEREGPHDGVAVASKLDSASDEEIFGFIDEELG